MPSRAKSAAARTVTMDMASRFEMLDMVQTVLEHLSATVGFAEETVHYMSVAVRESVVNAIKHGNHGDESKRVTVSFTVHPRALEVEVHDQGAGFDPQSVPDPVSPENVMKPQGRGVFFMRSFMDEVDYSFPARGGTVVRMVKKL
ncbi:MAG TPA: ATP-binding protein [Vicinamibacteria bacterium]